MKNKQFARIGKITPVELDMPSEITGFSKTGKDYLTKSVEFRMK